MSCYITYKGKNYTQEDFLDFLKSQIPTKTFTWARRAENSYEVSSKGDTRFSALNAKLKDGRTIEEAYQLDVKGYRAQGDNWRLGKGKAPLTSMTKEQTWQAYKNLWRQFLEENPTLEQDLRNKASGKVLTDMFASTDISQARALAELLNERKSPLSTLNNPAEFTNHSGGAKGYDAEWDLIGAEFGMINNKHYLLPSDGAVSDPRLKAKGVKPVDATNDVGPVALQGPATGEAQIAVTNAERTMGRIESNHTTRNTKKIRNYAQVKNADAVFAIGSLIPKGADITIARGQATRKALLPQVNGGTSVAVQLGITMGKPTYVFNQVANSTYSQGWYKWDNTVKDFVSTETPTLTKNFAGIGTSSNTTEAGKQAIRDVYEKTFNSQKNNTPYYEGDIVPEPNTIFVFGSNPEGRHGAGAAKVARDKFGAIYGQGEGLQGNAYALPTKDLRVKENKGFKSISPSEITESIKRLYQTATSNPNKQFKVAYRNTTTTSLNGYTGLEMIEMFKQAGPIPSNIIFSKEWYDAMSKETSSQVGQTSDNKTSTDTYQYYGAKYEIITVDGVGVQVKNYKGSHQNQQKLLQAYNNNKDIDPQNGKKFRNLSPLEELEQKITGGTSDTLSLSKYELFPGVYANEGQAAAIDAIEEFFAGDKDQFLLKGRGGTGKTTIVKKTLEQFDKSRVKILGSTISYEAKNVLQDNMQGYKTATLASVLGLIPDYAKDGSMFFREKTLEERMNNSGLITPLPIETVDILIVDEASMIDEFIYNKLLELKKPRTKILFMGDNVQIPPINSRTDEEGNVIKGENSDSPVWQLIDSGDYVELSERMRQGAESPILPITDLYAKNVEEIQSGETGLKNPLTDRTSNFQNNEGVLFTSDVNEVVNQFVEDIEGSTDIREAVIVGARNAVVDDMNLRVRKKLFETEEPFVIGDSIRINSPHVENNEVIFENGLRAKVKDVYELPEDNLGLKRYELEIEYIETNEKGDKFIRKAFLKTISPQDQKQYKNKLREMAARAKSFVPKTPESKKAWKEFFDIKSSTVDVGYGYAITSHKVQGSTYNSAYVLEGDIMSFPGGIEQTNRMMYTAVSRPRKKLVIFNPSVVESQQVSQPTKVDIRAKVYELFNLQGYMDIKTSHKTDKNLITAISHYVLEDLGYKTDQEKLQAVREGFKLSEYITTEQISDVHTRVRLNMKNIIEDEVDDGPVSLGGIKFTSSGYESDAKNAFTCK